MSSAVMAQTGWDLQQVGGRLWDRMKTRKKSVNRVKTKMDGNPGWARV